MASAYRWAKSQIAYGEKTQTLSGQITVAQAAIYYSPQAPVRNGDSYTWGTDPNGFYAGSSGLQLGNVYVATNENSFSDYYKAETGVIYAGSRGYGDIYFYAWTGASTANLIYTYIAPIPGDFVEYVYSTDQNAYPTDGVSGNYYYNAKTEIPLTTILTAPTEVMQGNQAILEWTAVDVPGVSYVLERNADNGGWTQIYSGAALTYTDTVGTWTSVQYRVKAGMSGVYGEYATSAAIPVVSASALVISGTDGDLGTLTGPVSYTVSSDTDNDITVTEEVNGVILRTYTTASGVQQSIPIPDLPTGSGSITIKASVQATAGTVNQTRNWTYTKTAPTFPSEPFDISILSKGGKTQFPLTLAEAVKMPYGHMLDDFSKYWWKRIGRIYSYQKLTSETYTIGYIDATYYYSRSEPKKNKTQFVLENPVTVQYTDGVQVDVILTQAASSGPIYLQNQVSNTGGYYVPQGTQFSLGPVSGSNYPVNFTGTPESYSYFGLTFTESTDYVVSGNRNAYPDSGESDGYEYEFLGMPFSIDNLLGGVQIATGSYVGTGTYGSNNPNTLTFEFEPQIVFIIAHSDYSSASGTSTSIFYSMIIPANSRSFIGSFSEQTSSGSASSDMNCGLIQNVSKGGTSVAFYGGSAVTQLNSNNVTYHYVALGTGGGG